MILYDPNTYMTFCLYFGKYEESSVGSLNLTRTVPLPDYEQVTPGQAWNVSCNQLRVAFRELVEKEAAQEHADGCVCCGNPLPPRGPLTPKYYHNVLLKYASKSVDMALPMLEFLEEHGWLAEFSPLPGSIVTIVKEDAHLFLFTKDYVPRDGQVEFFQLAPEACTPVWNM